MANYVESATLKLVDETSGKLDKINAAFKRLHATAAKPIKLNINTAQLQRAADAAERINKSSTATARAQTKLVQAQAQAKAQQASLAGQATAQAAQARMQAIQARQAAQQATLQARANNQAQALALRTQIAQTQTLNRVQSQSPLARTSGSRGNTRQSPEGFIAGALGTRILEREQRGRLGRVTAGGAASGLGMTGVIGMGLLGAALYKLAQSATQGIVAYDDANARLIQSGLTTTQAAERLNTATEISKDPRFRSISGAQLADSSLEVANQANSQRDARLQMENMARTSVILGTVFKDTARGAEETRQVFRALNLLGIGQDPVKSKAYADEAMRAIIAGGGDVTGQDFRRALQQLKAEGLELGPRAIGDLISMRDEGGRSSTADMRMFMSELTRSDLNKKDKALQAAAGFRDSSGVANQDVIRQFKEDPVSAILKTLLPRLQKAGVNIDDTTAVRAALQKQGLGQSASALPAKVITQREQFMADRMSRIAVDLESALDPTKQSLKTKTQAVNAQFQNMIAQATAGAVPVAGKALDFLSEKLAKGGQLDIGKDSQALMAAMQPGLLKALGDPASSPMASAAITLMSGAQLLGSASSAIIGWFGGGKTATNDNQSAMSKLGPAPTAPSEGTAALAAQALGQTKEWKAGFFNTVSHKRQMDEDNAKIEAQNAKILEARKVLQDYNTKIAEYATKKEQATKADAAAAETSEKSASAALADKRRQLENQDVGTDAASAERLARQQRIEQNRAKALLEQERETRKRHLEDITLNESVALQKRNMDLAKLNKVKDPEQRQASKDVIEEEYQNKLDKARKLREKIMELNRAEDERLNYDNPRQGQTKFGLMDPTKQATPEPPVAANDTKFPDALSGFKTSVESFVGSGATVGATIAGALSAQASAIGSAIGSAAAGQLQGIQLSVTAQTTPAANTGTQGPR